MRTYVATYKIDCKYNEKYKYSSINSKNIKIQYAKGIDNDTIGYITIIAKNRFELRGMKKSVEKILNNMGNFEKIISIG